MREMIYIIYIYISAEEALKAGVSPGSSMGHAIIYIMIYILITNYSISKFPAGGS